MKQIILSVAMIVALASCAGDADEKKDTTENGGSTPPSSMVAPADAALAAHPDYKKGVGMVEKFQCATCHKTDEKLTGPSYTDIANKYAPAKADTIARLAKKIIDGGSGVWGEIPMTPHPNITKEDAITMVKYIMVFKK